MSLDPFSILGIAPTTELSVVEAAYRAAAHRYHPDHAGTRSTAKMQAINWAREELRRDVQEWFTRVVNERANRAVIPHSEPSDHHWGTSDLHDVSAGWVELYPQVEFVSAIVGAAATFTARASGVTADAIKARVASNAPVDLMRAGTDGNGAVFRVVVRREPAFVGDDAYVLPVEVRAPGALPNTFFLSIQPLGSGDDPGRIPPPRHASANARVHFGQHKGRTYADIALENPGYLRWMIDHEIMGPIACECAKLALKHRQLGDSGTRQPLKPGPSGDADTQAVRPALDDAATPNWTQVQATGDAWVASQTRSMSRPPNVPKSEGGNKPDYWENDPARLQQRERRRRTRRSQRDPKDGSVSDAESRPGYTGGRASTTGQEHGYWDDDPWLLQEQSASERPQSTGAAPSNTASETAPQATYEVAPRIEKRRTLLNSIRALLGGGTK